MRRHPLLFPRSAWEHPSVTLRVAWLSRLGVRVKQTYETLSVECLHSHAERGNEKWLMTITARDHSS